MKLLQGNRATGTVSCYLWIVTCAVVLMAMPAAYAQDGQGVIRGVVTSAESGSPLADVYITAGEGNVTTSGPDGSYEMSVPAGAYEVRMLKSGFGEEVLAGVAVSAGQIVTRNAAMGQEIEQILVLGRGFIEGSEASALATQQESESVIEVVGSEEFSRIGDNTAADTLNRVTGLNIQEGKFVVIRGQPARYSSTLMNGSQLPSLDPIQTITPLDLFPSGVLSNIAVQKAFTANRPGSFGAGQVQLETTGIPAEDFFEIQGGTGVNFESIDSEPLEFATGGDLLGELDEILEVPSAVAAVQDAGTPIATLPIAEQNFLAQRFSQELAPGFATEGPDIRFRLNGGKRFDFEQATFGATMAFNYGQQMRTRDDKRQVLELGAGTEAVVQDDFEIDYSRLNTNMSGFFAMTLETDNHEIKSNTFWVRDTGERTEIREGVFQPSDSQYQRQFLLEFEKREMVIQQLTFEHNVMDYFDLAYRGLYSFATRDLPDRRTYTFQNQNIDGSGLFFLDDSAPNLSRRWNEVEEETYNLGLDVSIPVSRHFFPNAGFNLQLEGGVNREDRDRLSEVRTFGFNTSGNRFAPIEQIFSFENIGGTTTFTELGAGTGDDYEADFRIDGSYVQTDIEVPEMFRLVFGVRFEEADFRVTTFQSAGAAGVTPVESGFIRRDELPSLIGSWFINDSMQLRAGAARSMSYPSPIEISDTTFIDPDTDEQFDGNPDLQPVVIDSYDVRFEWYPTAFEAITVGFFYKDMEDPIERTINPTAGGGLRVTFLNAEKGEVIGAEINGRIGFDRFRYWLDSPSWMPAWVDDMHLSTNFTYQDSEVEIDPTISANTNNIRRMTGQPEILANVQLGYTGIKNVVRVTFGYQDERLINAGIRGLEDEFISERFSLNGRWSYNIIPPLTLSLNVRNLINDAFEREQNGFKTRSYKEGVTTSFAVKYRFD